MKKSDDEKFIPMTTVLSGEKNEVREDLFYFTNQIVNVVFVGDPASGNWVLVDAGMPKSAKKIISVAEKRFGKSAPQAIILTHGHFDHVGSLVDLIDHWKVPVYAHRQEFPFLTGEESYPESDTSVEGGVLAKISSMYPHEPVDVSEYLEPLPEDHSVPFLPDWKWVHTPGHSPGHVSFFRERDSSLIVGDAFVTVRQDSLYRVLIQKKEMNGPPVYLTTDWTAAKESVRKLADLQPVLAVPGHGPAMKGKEMLDDLEKLAKDFDELAIPAHGKYVHDGK